MLKQIIGQATPRILRLILILLIGLIVIHAAEPEKEDEPEECYDHKRKQRRRILATHAAEPEKEDEPEERYDHKRKQRERILEQWKGGVRDRPEEKRHNDHVTKLSFYEKFVPFAPFDPHVHLPNIDFLFRFPNLTDLDLEGCKCLKDNPDVLGRLTNLTALNLRCTFIPTLEPLKHLTKLTSLNLSGNNISRIRPIIRLPLRNLNLDRCTHIRDVHLLRNVTTLRELNLCMVLDDDDIPHPPLDFLSPLVNLRRLVLSSNDWISDLAPLQTLSKLIYLDLEGVKGVGDLSPIGHITSLRFLKAINLPRIKEINCLGTLPRLKLLLVDDGMIVTPDHLPTLKIVYRKTEVTITSFVPIVKTVYITK